MRRGVARSRAHAAEIIAGADLRVAGVIEPKASTLVDAGTAIEVAGPPPRFVGRGGLKLDAALERFGIDVAGRRALDAGASTGGFTDCLLQRGVGSVLAVDVGYGQLDDRIGGDPRVTVMDRTNIRHLDPTATGGTFDLVVGDLSFISLCTVAPALAGLASSGADLVMLVKPQFEVGKDHVGKGGIVTDASRRRLAVERVAECFAEHRLTPRAVVESPITGAKGNVEFLLWARKDGDPVPALEWPE